MENICWIFLFNVIVNSLCCFITMVFLVYLIAKLFRWKNQRLVGWIYSLIGIKILVDLCFYHYGSWALLHGLNPMFAEPNGRMLMVGLGPPGLLNFPWSAAIGFYCDQQLGFSIADMIALSLPMFVVQFTVISIFTISSLRFYFFLQQSLKSLWWLNTVKRQSKKYLFTIDPLLAKQIKRTRVEIVTSPLCSIPFASGIRKKLIVIPEQLLTWPEQEINTVIAHELEHLRYLDHLLLYFLGFVKTIFWWVPLGFIRKRLEIAFECHCDLAVFKYHLDPCDLALALVKVAKKRYSKTILVSTLSNTHLVTHRINQLLGGNINNKSYLFSRWKILFFAVCCFSLLTGRFWLF